MEKATDLLKEEMASKERKVIERFIKERIRNGLAVYGYEDTKKALENKQVEILIVSDEIQLQKVAYTCPNENITFEKTETNGHREAEARMRKQPHHCKGCRRCGGVDRAGRKPVSVNHFRLKRQFIWKGIPHGIHRTRSPSEIQIIMPKRHETATTLYFV